MEVFPYLQNFLHVSKKVPILNSVIRYLLYACWLQGVDILENSKKKSFWKSLMITLAYMKVNNYKYLSLSSYAPPFKPALFWQVASRKKNEEVFIATSRGVWLTSQENEC